MDQISNGNLIRQLFIWNFDKISVFQTVTTYYTNSYHSEKSLITVNNTPAIEIWPLLTCENCQVICRPYYWDEQPANISPLILMTHWLMAKPCSRKKTFHFLSVFNGPTSILSTQNHVCGIFLNSHKYFQEMFLRRIKDVTE